MTMTIIDQLLLDLNEREKEVPAFVERIAPVFKALDWCWADENGCEVPDKYKIMLRAYELIRGLRIQLMTRKTNKKFDMWFVSTGGITVDAVHYEDGSIETNMIMEIHA